MDHPDAEPQRFRAQGKPMRGLLLRYVAKMTGRSRTQVTRLVSQYMKNSEVKQAVYQRHRFASRFTRGDLELLAGVDEAHETMSGPATKRILNRAMCNINIKNMRGWLRFRLRIFITCETGGITANVL